MIFRNESEKVITKYERRNVKSHTPPSSRASKESLRIVLEDTASESDMDVLNVLPLPMEVMPVGSDGAVHYLFSHYLVDSHFRYLPELYAASPSASRLDDMLGAVSFAALALQSSSESLSARAQVCYADAVSKIKADLDDPVVRLQDETLAAVLLMALYETLRMKFSARSEAWEMHAQGAMALLEMRGSEQLDTIFGLHLFTHAATIIRFIGIQRGVSPPQRLSTLMKLAKARPEAARTLPFPWPQQSPFKPSSDAMEQFALLFADLEQGRLTEPYDIIVRADDVLHIIDLHASCLNLACARQLTPGGSEGDYFGEANHQLHWSPGLAQAWNNTYLARMKLNALINEHIPSLTLSEIGQLPAYFHADDCAERYHKAAIQAAQDIYDVSTRFFPDHPLTPSKPSTQKVADGYFLLWPLFLIGSQSQTAPIFRQKSTAKLRQISEALRLPHAKTAADILAGGAMRENWMHAAHVF